MKIRTTYQSTYFLLFKLYQGQESKNPGNPTSTAKVIGRTSLNVWNNLFYIELHLNLKQLGFIGKPMTQWTHQSCVNVNHMGT